MPRSLIAVANEVIPFPVAARWAGISAGGRAKTYCPFGAVEHIDGGVEQALRVYKDHGWCFAEQRYFSVVTLLAAVWEADREDAAAEALRRYGWKPVDFAHLWEQVSQEPAPDRDALAQALTTWCSAQCPSWRQRQREDRTADKLARCLGLLPLVHTREDCGKWLSACKQAMAPYLS